MQVNGTNPPADPMCASNISDVHAATNQLQRDCIGHCRNITDWDQTGIGRVFDGNTPKRAQSLKNDGSVIEVTPCRDQPLAGVLADSDNGIYLQLSLNALGIDLPLYWESPEAAKLFWV
jgi:hypothetical protein